MNNHDPAGCRQPACQRCDDYGQGYSAGKVPRAINRLPGVSSNAVTRADLHGLTLCYDSHWCRVHRANDLEGPRAMRSFRNQLPMHFIRAISWEAIHCVT